MRVLMRGKVRARRLIIANAAYDPPKHRGIGHVEPGSSWTISAHTRGRGYPVSAKQTEHLELHSRFRWNARR